VEQSEYRGLITCITQVSGVLEGLSRHITKDPNISFILNLLTPVC